MNDNNDSASAERGDPLLSLRDVTKEYKVDGRESLWRKSLVKAVQGVSLDVYSNETVAVVGESGSGKSTTARIACALIEQTQGSVTFLGREVNRRSRADMRSFRRSVQMVFQDPFSSLNPRRTVFQIVSAPMKYLGLYDGNAKALRARVAGLLEQVGLQPEHIDRYPHQFLGGQAQRIGIARALIVEPRVIICDEAVSALDVTVQAQILSLLKDLQSDLGLSYIFITHDMGVVRQIADRVLVMKDGQVVESGTNDEVFQTPQAQYTKTLLQSVPRIPADWLIS